MKAKETITIVYEDIEVIEFDYDAYDYDDVMITPKFPGERKKID